MRTSPLFVTMKVSDAMASTVKEKRWNVKIAKAT